MRVAVKNPTVLRVAGPRYHAAARAKRIAPNAVIGTTARSKAVAAIGGALSGTSERSRYHGSNRSEGCGQSGFSGKVQTAFGYANLVAGNLR